MKFWRGQRWLLAVALIGTLNCFAHADSVRSVSVADLSLDSSLGGSGDSVAPIISPDGRFVSFASTANNLLLTTNGTPIAATFPARFNVYLRDRTNGTTVLVSGNLAGTGGGNGDSMPTGLSTDGAYALFESAASDLVPNDTNNVVDIFVRNLVNGSNVLVSASTTGKPGNGFSRASVMTPDGRYVSFVSAATNLVSNDTNGIADVFVRDLQTGTTVLASVGATTTNLYLSSSESPEISDDGRYVAFYSTATNLVPGVNTISEIYVRDLVGGITTLVSTNTRVALSNANVVSYNHVISADGNYVAYAASKTSNLFSAYLFRYNLQTGLTDLVSTNAIMPYGPRENIHNLDITPDGRFISFVATNFATPSVWIWDGQSGVTTLVSQNITNGVAVGAFEYPVMDASGRFVAFTSTATNLTTDTPDFRPHVFVRDVQLNQTIQVDADTNGLSAGAEVLSVPNLSANGRFVAFESFEPQSGNVNLRRNSQIYLRDLQTNTVELISARLPELPSVTPNGPGDLLSFSLSADGRFVAFASLASNLAANDTNANRDIFVRDLLLETNVLASVGTNGFSAAGMSFEPAISSDGNFVAFTSMATNLISGDNNRMRDVFVADLQTKALTLGSVAIKGLVGDNASYSPTISEGGRFLLFRSKASNLTTNVLVSGSENLFLRDLQNLTTKALTTGGMTNAAMTPDGRFIAFVGTILNGASSYLYVWDSLQAKRVYTNTTLGIASFAISQDGNRLVYALTTGVTNLYAVDLLANTTWSIGAVYPGPRGGLKFSADGQWLVYASQAVETGTDNNFVYDVFLYNFQAKTKTLVSKAYNSAQAANRASDYPDVSHDGRFVVYRSAATNLVANDTNDWSDIFIFDRVAAAGLITEHQSPTNRLLSANASGNSGDNRSFAPVFSGDGRTLVFPSWASDLIGDDFNHSGDLFSFSLLYVTVARANPGEGPVISWPATADGIHQVQFKNAVDDPNWQQLTGPITFMGNKAFMQDSSPAANQRIYRVVAF